MNYHNITISGVRCWRRTLENVDIADAEILVEGIGQFVLKKGVSNVEANKIADEFSNMLYKETIEFLKSKLVGLKKAKE